MAKGTGRRTEKDPRGVRARGLRLRWGQTAKPLIVHNRPSADLAGIARHRVASRIGMTFDFAHGPTSLDSHRLNQVACQGSSPIGTYCPRARYDGPCRLEVGVGIALVRNSDPPEFAKPNPALDTGSRGSRRRVALGGSIPGSRCDGYRRSLWPCADVQGFRRWSGGEGSFHPQCAGSVPFSPNPFEPGTTRGRTLKEPRTIQGALRFVLRFGLRGCRRNRACLKVPRSHRSWMRWVAGKKARPKGWCPWCMPN